MPGTVGAVTIVKWTSNIISIKVPLLINICDFVNIWGKLFFWRQFKILWGIETGLGWQNSFLMATITLGHWDHSSLVTMSVRSISQQQEQPQSATTTTMSAIPRPNRQHRQPQRGNLGLRLKRNDPNPNIWSRNNQQHQRSLMDFLLLKRVLLRGREGLRQNPEFDDLSLGLSRSSLTPAEVRSSVFLLPNNLRNLRRPPALPRDEVGPGQRLKWSGHCPLLQCPMLRTSPRLSFHLQVILPQTNKVWPLAPTMKICLLLRAAEEKNRETDTSSRSGGHSPRRHTGLIPATAEASHSGGTSPRPKRTFRATFTSPLVRASLPRRLWWPVTDVSAVTTSTPSTLSSPTSTPEAGPSPGPGGQSCPRLLLARTASGPRHMWLLERPMT